MNYRHVYHAGNFADVVKHVVLTRLIEYLKRKDKAFRVMDTHAGIGLYDLSSTEAQKTGEWRDGIGRLAGIDAGAEVVASLARLEQPEQRRQLLSRLVCAYAAPGDAALYAACVSPTPSLGVVRKVAAAFQLVAPPPHGTPRAVRNKLAWH